MKNLMEDLLEAGRNASVVVVVMLLAAMLVYGVGCAGAHQGHGHAVTAASKAMTKAWKPSKRCKVLGKAMTTHVAVLVERNCLKNGVTTVNMVVLNKEKKGTVAARHAGTAITSILGFRPVLKVLFYGKAKGKPFFLTAVTGISSAGTVAAK
jgi:hypothetical protein